MKDNKPQGQLIPFTIHSVSSQDPEYPANELLTANHLSRGWQTERFAIFPQTLILRLSQLHQLQTLQLLSHQCKISSKIEIFISFPKEVHEEPIFRKLGYFSLGSNEGSSYQSRELKTVYIDAPVLFVKLVLNKPHVNSLNFFNQAGIIAISLFGFPLNSGAQGGPSTLPTKAKTMADLQLRTQMDPKTLAQIEQLERAKELAVQQEDYLAAKQIKEQIDRLKSASEQLLRLEQRKEIAIQNEDFEAAMILKEEISRLRSQYLTGGSQGSNQSPNPHRRGANEQDQRYRNLENKRAPEFESNEYEEQPIEHFENRRINQERLFKEDSGRNEKKEIQRQPKTQSPKTEEFTENNQFVQRIAQTAPEEQSRGRQNPRTANRERVRENPRTSPEPQNQLIQLKSQPTPDFDERPIPTLVQNSVNNNNNPQANPFTPENEYPDSTEEQTNETGQVSVPKKNLPKIEKLIGTFTRSFLNQSFSSSFQERLKAAEKLDEEVSSLVGKPNSKPSSLIFSVPDSASAMLGAWRLNLSFLEERIPQMTNIAFQISDNILLFCKNKAIANSFKQSGHVPYIIDELVGLISEKVADFKNTNIVDWSVFTLVETHNVGFCSTEELIEKFLTKKSGKNTKTAVSFKHLTGRLLILSGLVSALKAKCKSSCSDLLSFAVEGLENSNKSVRDESRTLILEVFKIIGESQTLKYLENSKIRKDHLESLRKDFSNPENDLSDPDENEPSEPFKNRKNTDERGLNIEPKQTSKLEKKNEKANSEVRPCNFCQLSNSKFADPNQFDIHLWKECPMLTICGQCMQVVEVSEYNTHLLDECKNSELFSKCPRCQQAIYNEDFDDHTTNMSCKPFKLDGKAVRCPLCLKDLTIKKGNPEELWREHLVQQGCASNDRTN